MSNKYNTSAEVLNKILIDDGLGNYFMSTKGFVTTGGSRVKLTTSQDLSISDMSYDITRGADFIIKNISIVSDIPISETIDVKVISSSPISEVELISQNVLNNSSIVLIPPSDYKIYSDETLRISCTNNNLSGNITLIVNIEEV